MFLRFQDKNENRMPTKHGEYFNLGLFARICFAVDDGSEIWARMWATMSLFGGSRVHS